MSDYYSLLGVSKGASQDEVKKAFRQKAKEHHPDKGGDEKVFKQINEAYEVLGDEQKRAQYDQFGSAGPNMGGFGGGDASGFAQNFGGFEDIFSSFFGGGGGRGQQKSSPQRKGSDLEVSVRLTFEEAIKGTQKTFKANRYQPCEKCEGKGGSGQKTCGTCSGSGQQAQKFQTPFGMVQQQTTCGTCSGQGFSFEETCGTCKGQGRTEGKASIEVDIPAGVEEGMTLRLRDQGDAGVQGGSKGDLYVHIQVEPSKVFQRNGLDLITTLEIPILDAITGTDRDVETFWGKVTLTIPEKTPDQRVLRIPEKGVQRDGQIGHHLVQIKHIMPKKISGKLAEKLEEAKKLA